MYRLLIADDEESIRSGIAQSIPWAALGYEVCALCANGQEVLDCMEQCRPDVVLSDIRMPGVNGLELMQRLNRDYPNTKIVVLSGYSDFEYLNMSIKNKVTEYLLKPTDTDEFEQTFRRLKETMDRERARRAELNESERRHFDDWLSQLLKDCASPRDTERFLPLLNERGIDLDNAVVVVFTVDDRAADEGPDLHRLCCRLTELLCALPQPGDELSALFFLTPDCVPVGLYSAQREIEADEVRAHVASVQRQVRGLREFTVSAGISNLCTEPGMLPQAYEQAVCSAKQNIFYGRESVYQFRQLAADRPEQAAYFDVDLIDKCLLAQDYDAIRAEVNRVFASFGNGPVQEYQYVDRLCLSVLFHLSLWGLRYGVQLESVMRTLGTTYTDIYLCDTLNKKREFVLALLFATQQETARRRSQGHANSSVA
ncbi:MAG: response regulator, partial [Gemmiger sp.]